MAKFIVTKDFVQELFESEDPFPVDFSDAWRWLGYSKESNAKKMLTTNFEEHEDFCPKWTNKENTNASGFVRVEEIRLTADCFRELGMLAQTEQGRLVRKYYLQCERFAKKTVREQLARLKEMELDQRIREEVRARVSDNPAGIAAMFLALGSSLRDYAEMGRFENLSYDNREFAP